MAYDSFLSRRHFLQSAGSLTGAAYLRLTGASLIAITESACTARDESAAFKVLTSDEAVTIAAIAARIIPTTDTPGASEAGVIYYIDNVLGNIMQNELAGIRKGLTEFDAALAQTGRKEGFATLAPDDQDDFLRSREGSELFETLRWMTIDGFLSMEKYGGNRNHVGWKLIGFEGHRGAWTYPFGHYDAEVHGKAGDEK